MQTTIPVNTINAIIIPHIFSPFTWYATHDNTAFYMVWLFKKLNFYSFSLYSNRYMSQVVFPRFILTGILTSRSSTCSLSTSFIMASTTRSEISSMGWTIVVRFCWFILTT